MLEFTLSEVAVGYRLLDHDVQNLMRMHCTETSLESWNTPQRLLAVGANVYHVLAVRNAKWNETTSQQNTPVNNIKTCILIKYFVIYRILA